MTSKTTLATAVPDMLPQGFIDEFRSMIDQTREFIAVAVNSNLTMLL